jgi:hypothetical protein
VSPYPSDKHQNTGKPVKLGENTTHHTSETTLGATISFWKQLLLVPDRKLWAMRYGVRRNGLTRRQTPLSYNYKTVIRRAGDSDAKLGKIKYADGNGDAPELVPTPKIGDRATVSPEIGRAGFSSTDGQIGYDPTRRGVAVSRSGQATRVRQQRWLYVSSGQCRPVSVRGLEREHAADRGQDGSTRPSAPISEPSDRWLPVR